MITINGDSLTVKQVYDVAVNREQVELSEEAVEKIRKSRDRLVAKLEEGKPIYGVNTGFGSLLNVSIPQEKIIQLQKNLIRSHSSGVGEPLPDEHVRAIMVVRANNLSKGYSGVRVELVQMVINMLNRGIHPIVPRFGSVGASGDLAPLAHIALCMMGEGKVKYNNNATEAQEVFTELSIAPHEFVEKEGVAFINGTSAISGILSVELHRSYEMFRNSILSASLSFEGLKGTDRAIREWAMKVRPYRGQELVSKSLRELIKDSEIIRKSSERKVQDAYSLRCIPQVYGAVLDTLDYGRSVLSTEINSATDNPLIGEEEIISAGNFHGEPVSLICDFVAIALTDLGNIIERRIARIVDASLSGLPPFLVSNSGYNSGYMIPQYTAAALCNRNKTLSMPSTADNIPTSANQEDHVSMGANAAIKLSEVVANLQQIVAIEYLLGAQSLEFALDSPSPNTTAIWKKIREQVPALEEDRAHYADIEKIAEMMRKGEILSELSYLESLYF
ncbi:histidine ammonia-lyase [uncultured archaeon]|nr:histidine ammonia-lyase [uncultured archaeon]